MRRLSEELMETLYPDEEALDEWLYEEEDDIVFSKNYKGIGKFRIRRAMKKAGRMLRAGGGMKEVFIAEFQESNGKWEPQPQRSYALRDAKRAISELVSAVRRGDDTARHRVESEDDSTFDLDEMCE